jgi:hypothetical protein
MLTKPSQRLSQAMDSNYNQQSQGSTIGQRPTREHQRAHILATRTVSDRQLQALTRRIANGDATIRDRRAIQIIMRQIDDHLDAVLNVGDGPQIQQTMSGGSQATREPSSTLFATPACHGQAKMTSINHIADISENSSARANFVLPPSSTYHPASNALLAQSTPRRSARPARGRSMRASLHLNQQNEELEYSTEADNAATSSESSASPPSRQLRLQRALGQPFWFSFEPEERPPLPSFPLRQSGSGSGS